MSFVVQAGALLLLLVVSGQVAAEPVRVAVASNFLATARTLAASFEDRSGHAITLISGSTGKHYAQIKHGAPFHAFFAADSERPRRLDEEGIAEPGTRFSYALGKLVLWSPLADYVDAEAAVLGQNRFRHLAIANPKLAPYGRAAQEVLQARGLWASLRGRMVRGENIGQTFQFVKSGNAQLGFVAASQIRQQDGRQQDGDSEGSLWEVPQDLYAPIEQQAVLLQDNDVARAFLAFVRSPDSRDIIRLDGYGLPR